MDDYFRISLKKLRIYSYIGVIEQERLVGHELEVNIDISYPGAIFELENIDSTVSYADIFHIVKEESSGEWLLLESLAQSIARRVISEWEFVEVIKVSMTKLSPPVAGMEGVGEVTYILKNK